MDIVRKCLDPSPPLLIGWKGRLSTQKIIIFVSKIAVTPQSTWLPPTFTNCIPKIGWNPKTHEVVQTQRDLPHISLDVIHGIIS